MSSRSSIQERSERQCFVFCVLIVSIPAEFLSFLTGSQASASAHRGPDAGGGRTRCADAQEQVPAPHSHHPGHRSRHHLLPEARLAHHGPQDILPIRILFCILSIPARSPEHPGIGGAVPFSIAWHHHQPDVQEGRNMILNRCCVSVWIPSRSTSPWKSTRLDTIVLAQPLLARLKLHYRTALEVGRPSVTKLFPNPPPSPCSLSISAFRCGKVYATCLAQTRWNGTWRCHFEMRVDSGKCMWGHGGHAI